MYREKVLKRLKALKQPKTIFKSCKWTGRGFSKFFYSLNMAAVENINKFCVQICLPHQKGGFWCCFRFKTITQTCFEFLNSNSNFRPPISKLRQIMRSTRNRNQEITNQVKSNFADDVVPPKWKKDDLVLCRYLTLNPEIYYEAKIVKVTESQNGPIYSIHYQVLRSFLLFIRRKSKQIIAHNLTQ